MREARLDTLPATGRVVDRVERGVDAAPSRLGEQPGGRGAVERGHDERAGDVQRSACEDLRRKLLGGGARRSHRARGGTSARPLRSTSTTLAEVGTAGSRRTPRASRPRSCEQADDEVAEGVLADLADDEDGESEPGEPGRRVERAAAAVERDLVHERHRSVWQFVDGSRDHVGDEDAEADDVRRDGSD